MPQDTRRGALTPVVDDDHFELFGMAREHRERFSVRLGSDSAWL
jgi:hypothetical protein